MNIKDVNNMFSRLENELDKNMASLKEEFREEVNEVIKMALAEEISEIGETLVSNECVERLGLKGELMDVIFSKLHTAEYGTDWIYKP